MGDTLLSVRKPPRGEVLRSPRIVVSKKVEPTSVGRNRVRRRIRAALAFLAIEGDTNFVVYAKKDLREALFSEIEKSLKQQITVLKKR